MSQGSQKPAVPIIDIYPLVKGSRDETDVAEAIGHACEEYGFFYIVNHGIDPGLIKKLEELSAVFFRKPESKKMAIAMQRGGRAWRGYFPVGQELTSGKPDLKEGLYFGEELSSGHPLVMAQTPMHGANLFPFGMPEFRETVLSYITAMTGLGHKLMRGLSLSLDLEGDYFYEHFTRDPLTLFRIFNYPPQASQNSGAWGVGEHTDYGVLTILKQDDIGGLQVKAKSGWIDAPPIPNSFVCNIGDMLDRMTGGRYLSTPHRVKNASGKPRLSFPFFFDPNFFAEVKALPLVHQSDLSRAVPRWDNANLHAFHGTYGDYILGKVAKVFPELLQGTLQKP